MKILFGMALRQTTGLVERLLRLTGLGWAVPDFSTICRRQRTLALNIPYSGRKGPLHLLVDSTGIEVEGEGAWNARKLGRPKRRVWRKIHIGVDEQTLEIRAVESSLAIATASKEPVDGSNTGDAPMLPHLLNRIPRDQEIGSVTADDGAYDTRRCHNAIADRAAAAFGNSFGPVAIKPSLPPRKNTQPWKPTTADAIAGSDALRESRYPGRALWRNWSGYHRRCRRETRMHCVKLLSQRLMARDFDRQVAEIRVRIAILNGYTALGNPVTKAVG